MKTKTEASREFRKTHPEFDAEWRAKNQEKIKQQAKQYRERNKEKEKARCKTKYLKTKSEHPETIKTWYKKYGQTPKGKFNSYKKNAKSRGLNFDITFEQFMWYWKKPCRYCGEVIETIGIDRIDSKIGYEIGNIGPCCCWCNRMKMDHGDAEFLEKCKKVVNFIRS